jgi:hypothetical protein
MLLLFGSEKHSDGIIDDWHVISVLLIIEVMLLDCFKSSIGLFFPKYWNQLMTQAYFSFPLCIIPYDKICMMTTRLACNRAIESSYWGMDNDWDVGLLTGYVLYRLRLNWNSWIWIPFPVDLDCTLLCAQVDKTRYSSIASGNNCIVQPCKCVSLHL